MNFPKLSILIPTFPTRKEMRGPLIESLTAQAGTDNPVTTLEKGMLCYRYKSARVEILVCEDENHSIGFKRQLMLEMSKGEYVVFVDDDDHVSDQYISLILAALEKNPDVVGMIGTMTTNGERPATWEISRQWNRWMTTTKKGLTHYLRSPNHLVPIRRSIAIQVGYEPIRFAEDARYSEKLVKMGLCKTEVKIPVPIYHYDYRTK